MKFKQSQFELGPESLDVALILLHLQRWASYVKVPFPMLMDLLGTPPS